MPDHRLQRCRAAYDRALWRPLHENAAEQLARRAADPVNYTEYGDVQVPAFTDDDEPENPPRHDDVWDQLPILERGWNVIEGEPI